MTRWLRVVLPPWYMFLACALWWGGIQALMAVLERHYGQPFQGVLSPLDLAAFFIAAAFYGCHRVMRFHPSVRPSYLHWLAASPWTIAKPLPLGPVHLVAQDGLILGRMVALAWPIHGLDSLVIIQGFAWPYLAFLGFALLLSEVKPFAYAVGVGMGFMGLTLFHTALFFAAVLVTYLTAYAGFRRSLAQLPVPKRAARVGSTPRPVIIGHASSFQLGWPFGRLGPNEPDSFPTTGIKSHDAVGLAVLAGWWLFAVRFHVHDPKGRQFILLMMPSFIVAISVFWRVGFYLEGYAPPISLAGRITTGRFIIPGYDRVFVAPILAVLIGIGGPALVSQTTADLLWLGPLILAISMAITLGLGPSIRDWHLTGDHRISFGGQKPHLVKVG